MDQYRQGDVFIERIATIPEEAQPVNRVDGRLILAEGEVTGHAHAILDRGAELLETKGRDELWLRVDESGATLRHEEHAAIALPPGTYRVVRQREFVPPAPNVAHRTVRWSLDRPDEPVRAPSVQPRENGGARRVLD